MISDATDFQQSVICAYDLCECKIVGAMQGASYCSDYCREAEADIEREVCGCGHPPCDAGP